MKRLYLILAIFIFAFSALLFAETIAYQGFEEDALDTWNYTATTVGSGYWGLMDAEFGGAEAQSGQQYWASWLMGANEGIITFANQELPLGYIYSFNFHYYSRLLNPATDYFRYSLSYDNGLSWSQWSELLPDTQAWTEVLIEIPGYERQVMLKVSAKHNGTGKYAHWDSFALIRQEIPPQAPSVYNVQIAQRMDGSGLVDIHYDLFDINDDPCTISLLVSDDDGASFAIVPDPVNLSGDIGAGLACGTGKHLIWNAGAESLGFEGEQYRFRLLAEDGTTGMAATPVFDPPGGSYFSEQIISISCASSGATIYYTTDGSEPDESSTVYASPIVLSTAITLKARAYKAEWQASETAVASYLIMPENFVFVEGGTVAGITVSSFYMDKYELTQAEYQAVMGTNPSYFGGNPNHPVERVSWFNAIEYCNRRSMAEELTPCYSYSTYGTDPANWPAGWNSSNANHTNVSCDWSAIGYRLPSEAEWEYAARGGLQTHGYTYSGSNTIGNVAWYSSNSGSTTHTVGTKAPNELGIYDMSGNVWEWCWDVYSGSDRVLRGGSWNLYANYCTVSYRDNSNATNGYSIIGFRCVRVSF